MKRKIVHSFLHLAIQNKILTLLEGQNVKLEYTIGNRRTDIFWKDQMIAFEIQCSPISLIEARRRTNDLQRSGLNVFWILHQKTFNKRRLYEAEAELRDEKIAYYTNITQHRDGIIFDQEEAITYDEERIARSFPIEIDISQPKKTITGRTHFKNDLTDLGLKRLLHFKGIWKEKTQTTLEWSRIYARYAYTYLKHHIGI